MMSAGAEDRWLRTCEQVNTSSLLSFTKSKRDRHQSKRRPGILEGISEQSDQPVSISTQRSSTLATVSEREARVQTADGPMTTFFAAPEGPGPFPTVVLYMDAAGLRDELRGIGRRVAGQGYYAVVPDLYHRFGDGITFDASKLRDPDSGEVGRMFAQVEQLSDDAVMADTRALLDELAGDPLASDGPRGAVGFCLGGRLVVRALTTFPDAFAAGSALHPTRIVREGPDSPHLRIGEMRAELYVGLGGGDSFQPPELFEPARKELERHGIAHLVEVQEGADHGYMVPDMPTFDEQASERCWERTFELFDRTLRAPVPA
jgi:carboxymethylenebutenolidase